MHTVTSTDGTPITFDQLGAGTPVILVGGALCDRASTRPLAEALVYGHSSGAGLALRAAAHGLPITKLVLHEPPFAPNSGEARRGAQELAIKIGDLLADDRRADTIRHFLTSAGAPPEYADAMAADPRVLALAHTLAYDLAVMGNPTGAAVPAAEVARITADTMVLCGGASPAFFTEAAQRIADLLPHGHYTVLNGQTHAVAAKVLGPVLNRFLSTSPD